MTIGGWELNSAAFEEILDINFYDVNRWIDHINTSQIQYQIGRGGGGGGGGGGEGM